MFSRGNLEKVAEVLQGLPVLGCLREGTAAEAGVRFGDILITVNGVPTPTVGDFVRARALRADGYQIELFRDGETVHLYVPFRKAMHPMEMLLELSAAGSDDRLAEGSSSAGPGGERFRSH